MAEVFDWKQWFTGFIDPTRILKDAGTLLRMALILGICVACWLGIKEVRKMFGKPTTPTSTVQNMTGGHVENTGAKTRNFKLGLFNF